MRLSRPQRYDGSGDAQVLDEFVAACGPAYTSTLNVKRRECFWPHVL